MIRSIFNGDIFESKMTALVNPVNCVGVMGKGLALQFKNKYPDYYREYRTACINRDLQLGTVLLCFDTHNEHPVIISFPTKYHWKDVSKIEHIRDGLIALVNAINIHDIDSVAIPALGCGEGGLSWADVEPLVYTMMHRMPHVKFEVYEPYPKEVKRGQKASTKVR